MPERWSDEDAQAAIVCVVGATGQSVGMGVLLGERRVLTCAHVVNAALQRPERAQQPPTDVVSVGFPLLGDHSSDVVEARVERWVPPSSDRSAGDDIALLTLLTGPPAGARPTLLLVNPPARGADVHMFGRPLHRAGGVWAPAIIRGTVGNGRIQLDGDADAAWQAQRGFSGTPVFDGVTGRVAGLFAETTPGRTGVRDGYAISADRLRQVWPDVFARSSGKSGPYAGAKGPGGDGGTRQGPLTVLHVSDPQFGRHHLFGGNGLTAADQARDTLFQRLHDDLDRLAADPGLRPDLVVVSGDLAEWGLRSEFEEVGRFLVALSEAVQLPRHRVVVVPGNHDVNRKLCEGYFLRQEGEEQPVAPPYWPKWEPFAEMFRGFYDPVPGVVFSPGEPWTLFEMPDLAVVVAGLNSTMAESHRDEDHYGWLGEEQLRWFADRLESYRDRGWLRLGVVHHNAVRGAARDDENLRDADDLDRWLGQPRLLNLLLHGHTHDARLHRLPSGLVALSTGSAAVDAPARPTEVPNQYQLLTIDGEGVTRCARQYAVGQKRWISDPRISDSGSDWRVRERQRFDGVHATFPDAAHKLGESAQSTGKPATAPSMSFLDRVLEATAIRFPTAVVTPIPDRGYLRVTCRTDGVTIQWPVGVVDGELTEASVDDFAAVHAQFAAADPTVPSELVCSGRPPGPGLVLYARHAGLRTVRSFVEYQGLLDLRTLAERQSERLAADPLYPGSLYVQQRYRLLGARAGEVRENLLDQVIDWLGAESARFLMVLGDFGRGKTSLLRQLARTMSEALPGVLPILIELRSLEKAPSIDELLAQYLIRQGVEDFNSRKLEYMIRSGRVALLFDGFDELELRVGYDNAADYLQVLLSSVTGQAKVVLTSRTQHFLSDDQVRTALGQRIAGLGASRIVVLEDFTPEQILTFLANQYGGDEARAAARFAVLNEIEDLLGLSRNPRMLAWISALDDDRLREIQSQSGRISAAELYHELVDHWLIGETTRQTHRHGLPTLAARERLAACTELAVRLWSSTSPVIALGTLTATVASTLTALADRGYDIDQVAHAVGSGSLLVRTEEGGFAFVHASVMEWLVADAAARQVVTDGSHDLLGSRQMSRLMVDFFIDLADPGRAHLWARTIVAATDAPATAKQNALAVLARVARTLPDEFEVLERQQLAGVDLRGQDLAGRDLRQTDMRGADLRGMRLIDVDLAGADLTEARLDGAQLIGGSLREAVLTGSSWRRAGLLGVDGIDTVGSDTEAPVEWDSVAVVGVDRSEPMILPSGRPAALAFNAAGDLLALAVGSNAGIADVDTGRFLRILSGHTGSVNGVVFSPDGTLLATSSNDHTVRIWDIRTGTSDAVLTGHTKPVNGVAFSPDGTLLASTSADHTARIWNVRARTGIALTGHEDAVRGVAFSPDGTLLATASNDHTVRIWQVGAGTVMTTLTGHPTGVNAVAFSPDGTLLATSASFDAIRIWDIATGTIRTTLATSSVYFATLNEVAFSPDGTLLATASNDQTVQIWDVATGTGHTALTGHVDDVTGVAFSPDGTLLATTSANNTAQIWDIAAGAVRVQTTRVFHHFSWGVAFSPDGTLLATTSADNTARIWDIGTGTTRAHLTGHTEDTTGVAFSPDGTLLATTSKDGTARLWDTATGAFRSALTRGARRKTSMSKLLWGVAFSPDGRLLVAACGDGNVLSWDVANGRSRKDFTGLTDAVYGVAFSPDGSLLAATSVRGEARIWDVATGATRHTLRNSRSQRLWGVTFSPDGRLLATTSPDHEASRLWDVATGQVRTVLSGHTQLWGLSFAPDGSVVAAACNDGAVRIWDVATGAVRTVLTGHVDAVYGVAFSPDGRLLATTSNDGTVRIWDGAAGDLLVTLVPLPEGGHAALLPDGSYKLSGEPGDILWWAVKLCRFEPGELDPYDTRVAQLGAGVAVLPPEARIRHVNV
ncbi:metallophosphoesterase [Actinoplanes sp. NPDC051475]|uniref:metallophosphoesterase n=1 Tax=Actinoplanes sp. NPDC051475 TaxID=3157225 RepID=UPI003450143C